MQSCLTNIISVKDYCNLENNLESSSGYELMNAPEISLHTIQAMIKEDQLKSRDYLLLNVNNAILEVRNDFLGVLSGNGFTTNLNNQSYQTSEFLDTVLAPSNLERGLAWYAVSNQYNSLVSTKIENIYFNSNGILNGAQIKIYDGDELTTITVNVIEGKNTFAVNMPIKSRFVRVVMVGNQVQARSTKLTCFVGCNGTTPNSCGYTKSINGDVVSTKESYGLGISFSCFCDYEKLLCNLSQAYIGKLIYLKSRIMLLDNRIMSDRFNNLITYGRDEAIAKKNELTNEYNQSWNTMVQSLPKVLQNYGKECIECNGISYNTNV